ADVRREGNLDEWVHLQNELDFNLAGHFLHSVFWRNIAPPRGDVPKPSQDLVRHIEEAFGSFDDMREQFWVAGRSINGCGWIGLVWDYTKGELAVRHIHERDGASATDPVPVLVMDMWEHAYFLQHHAEREGWLRDFWGMINWWDVSHNFDLVKMYRPAVAIDPELLHE
ncbi:MAG TPA: Fe-Mn family superoxide dismutase, partial [Woeseiaceae bacterium]|nr:Fe-Mn family superoxide dismutase [Woeseiaceae bacterium]